jgi:hypothetical protein
MPNPLLLNGILESQKSGHLYTLAGSYDALASVTVPSGGLASVTFAGIPTGYTHLQIRILTRGTGSGGYPTSVPITLNGDTTSGNYYFHHLSGNGASASSSSGAGYATNTLMSIPNAANTASAYSAGIIDILDYASITKAKTIRSLNGVDLNNSSGFPYSGSIYLASMMWNPSTPTAITSITFTADPTYSVNFAQYSSFALYGVK